MLPSSSILSVSTFCTEQCTKVDGDFKTEYLELSELFSKRLWHQLGQALLKFVTREDATKDGESVISLFENVVFHCAPFLNQLTFAEIVTRVSVSFTDLNNALHFCEKSAQSIRDGHRRDVDGSPSDMSARMTDHSLVLEGQTEDAKQDPGQVLNREAQAGIVLIQLECAHIKLIGQAMSDCRRIVEEVTEKVDDRNQVWPASVMLQYYRVCVQLYKVAGDADKYLSSAMLYLTYLRTDSDSRIPLAERRIFAADIALAALLSRKCYDFGTLVTHPILDELSDELSWLRDVLDCFNAGDLRRWRSLSVEHGKQVRSHASVGKELAFIEQKIRLMALVCLAFESKSRHSANFDLDLSFRRISQHCEVQLNEVELLAMRGFSLGLLKGSIDQIRRIVHISFVTPRILTLKQVSESVVPKIETWSEVVSQVCSDFSSHLQSGKA